jgi:hypothetical protein
MKTTIDNPDAALADAMRFAGAKTKREAVVKALEEYRSGMASGKWCWFRGCCLRFNA